MLRVRPRKNGLWGCIGRLERGLDNRVRRGGGEWEQTAETWPPLKVQGGELWRGLEGEEIYHREVIRKRCSGGGFEQKQRCVVRRSIAEKSVRFVFQSQKHPGIFGNTV